MGRLCAYFMSKAYHESIYKFLHASYVYLDDLLLFMRESDAKIIMTHIGGAAECDKISKGHLKNWVVNSSYIPLPSLF